MSRQIGFLIAIFCGGILLAGQQGAPPLFHPYRKTASDLEISGMVRGVPPGESRFVSREWLRGLPQVSLTMKHSDDFPAIPKTGVAVSGVYLDSLAHSLGINANSSAIEVACLDGYTATYSEAYIRQHRPFLVITIENMSLHEWAIKNHQYDPEPYFIGYEDFEPSFRVLSHQDERLEPTGLARLYFDTQENVYKGIRPAKAKGGDDTPVMQGYRIAQQNCFRCHNAGDHGGTKARKDWRTLGLTAKTRPKWFRAWVHDPQAIDAKTTMPANKDYDAATLTALQRYFATFAVEGQ